MITEIINSFVNVRNKVKNATTNEWVDLEKTEYNQKSSQWLGRTIADGELYPIFSSFGKEVTLEMFEIGMDSAVCTPVLYIDPASVGETYNGNIFHVITRSSGRGNATPNYILLHGSTYLTSERTDSGDKIMLKKSIHLPKGCYLGLIGRAGGGKVTYKAYWTEKEGGL